MSNWLEPSAAPKLREDLSRISNPVARELVRRAGRWLLEERVWRHYQEVADAGRLIVREDLRRSDLARILATDFSLLPDMSEQLHEPVRTLYRLTRPRNTDAIFAHVARFLDFYLHPEAPMPLSRQFATLQTQVAGGVLVLVLGGLALLQLHNSTRWLPIIVVIFMLGWLALAAATSTTPLVRTFRFELYDYLVESYSERDLYTDEEDAEEKTEPQGWG